MQLPKYRQINLRAKQNGMIVLLLIWISTRLKNWNRCGIIYRFFDSFWNLYLKISILIKSGICIKISAYVNRYIIEKVRYIMIQLQVYCICNSVLNCDASWPGHLKFEYGIINVPREDIAHIDRVHQACRGYPIW